MRPSIQVVSLFRYSSTNGLQPCEGFSFRGCTLHSTRRSNEFVRITFAAMGLDAVELLEVPIISLAFIRHHIRYSWSYIRTRTVAQPKNKRRRNVSTDLRGGRCWMNRSWTLFLSFCSSTACPVPYVITKFTVFDASTVQRACMAQGILGRARGTDTLVVYNIGRKDVIYGGTAKCIFSNRSDWIISNVKKSKEVDACLTVRGNPKYPVTRRRRQNRPVLSGPSSDYPEMCIHRKLVIYNVWCYSLIQFALGIETEDLKLNLDVLDGALQKWRYESN